MKSTIAKRMNKLLSLCLALFACLALSATAFADPKTAKKYAREATKAYADGNYELALAKFEQAYAEDANPALLYNMGRVYENQANFDALIQRVNLLCEIMHRPAQFAVFYCSHCPVLHWLLQSNKCLITII